MILLLIRCGKENRGGLAPSPAKNPSLRLELEFDSEASVERTLVARVGVTRDARGSDSIRLAEINVQSTHGALLVLIHTEQRALIGEVEQVSRQPDLGPFRKPDRIVRVEVDRTPVLRTAQRAASGGAIDRVVRAERD